jgi:dolichol-phosphate mannosyltransferase
VKVDTAIEPRNGQAAPANTDLADHGIVLLTVLVPCYNEAAILAETVRRLESYFEGPSWRQGQAGDWEVLFVDDGSSDDSAVVLRDLAARHEHVRFISYQDNGGQGKALQKGIEQARGTWVFCVDADLDYAPGHAGAMLDVALRQGADLVVGSPFMTGGAMRHVPRSRWWMSRLMNWYFSKVLRLGVSTYTSILRLYRRQALQQLLLTSNDKDILPEILIKACLLGLKVVEVPAVLEWNQETTKRRGKGINFVSTARKAVRHLFWGVAENPFFFFLIPASVAGVTALWFGIALLILFRAHLDLAPPGSVLQHISHACNQIIVNAPQTCFIFALAVQTSLILLSIGLLVFQNKTKKEHDFLYFTKLFQMMQVREKRDNCSP